MTWWQWLATALGCTTLLPFTIYLCVSSARMGWLRAKQRVDALARQRSDDGFTHPKRRNDANGKHG